MIFKVQNNAMDNKRVMSMLGQSLERESNLWKPFIYKERNETVEIGPNARNKAVRWLVQLTRKFCFRPETLALSTTIMDRFLQLVKAGPRHLNCIGLASFYLAAKTIEEDEVIPSTLEFVQVSQCGCSVAEVLRMERCILDKLEWNLRASTPLEFLQIFHALLMSTYPHLLDAFPQMTPSKQMANLTSKLQIIVMDARSLIYPPSTLALALLSLELELFWPQWLGAMITIQSLLKVEVQEVIGCRELLSSILSTWAEPCAMHLYAPSQTAVINVKVGAMKRKVEQMEEDDDIYDGIKRLYNEDEGGSLQCFPDFVDTASSALPMAVAN
jgi:hypothetical protein